MTCVHRVVGWCFAGTLARMNEAKRLIYELIEQCEAHRHGDQRVQKMTEKVLARCVPLRPSLCLWYQFASVAERQDQG